MYLHSEGGMATGFHRDVRSSLLEDRFSSLPDEVLGMILSHLWTTQAVQTSILSKRWRHVWTNISSIRLSTVDHEMIISRSHGRRRRRRNDSRLLLLSFLNFADEILNYFCHSHGRGILIREFVYVVDDLANKEICGDEITSHVRDALIHFKIERMKLSFFPSTVPQLPLPSCSSILMGDTSSLRVLDWKGPSLSSWCSSSGGGLHHGIAVPNNFTALKELTLRRVNFYGYDNRMRAEVFSRCPSLETLILSKCRMAIRDVDRVFEINIPTLVKLVIACKIHVKRDFPLPKVVALTPRLSCFKYRGYYPLTCTVQNDNDSFDEVEMDIRWYRWFYPGKYNISYDLHLFHTLSEFCRANSFRICWKALEEALPQAYGLLKQLLVNEVYLQRFSTWFELNEELQALILEAADN